MRVGPEQFIYRDFAFIDAMILPVVGFQTVGIYDILRRYIWRATEQGSRRARAAFKDGKLAATISRSKLAMMTGLSVRTIQREINKLRDIGWVRSESGNGTGETVVYELGYRSPETGEVFYADVDARELWYGLEGLAADEGWDRVTNLPCEARQAFTAAWFEGKGSGDSRDTTPVTAVTPPPGGLVTRVAPRIENPSGREIEKAEEYAGRSAPAHTPGPKHWDAPSGRKQRSSSKDEEQDSIGSKIALDNALDSGEDEGRFERAAAAATNGKAKADSQQEANIRRKLKRQRTEQVKRVQQDEQRSSNLKGGTKYTHAVIRAARDSWDVYTSLIKTSYPSMPVVRWNADGNAKARGQMCRLVDMYGGEATQQAIRYMVGNWDAINARFFKKGPGSVPNFGLLTSMHESLFRESALWDEHREVVEEWEAWQGAHADDDETPPSELQGRYENARTALESLGLGA